MPSLMMEPSESEASDKSWSEKISSFLSVGGFGLVGELGFSWSNVEFFVGLGGDWAFNSSQ